MFPEFDSIQHSILSIITKVHAGEHGLAQASLQVKFGGQGVKSAEMLAPAAFLVSTSSTFGLVQLQPPRLKDCPHPAFDGMDVLTQGTIDSPPTNDVAFRHKAWNNPHVRVAFESLLISAYCDRV